MKKLLNTLYITSEDIYLSLDGENIVCNRKEERVARYPLHTISDIISFSYCGASTALMGACASRNIGLSFCTPRGKFLSRICGVSNGNVFLRRSQYRIADDPIESCFIARTMIFGKLYNTRWSIERTLRDHPARINVDAFRSSSKKIRDLLKPVLEETSMDNLRGLEGVAAKEYFNLYDDMILNGKETFYFKKRNRRPPLDPINAMLSFSYYLLASECESALESVGFDSYVGFLHRDRPGRTSLALDIMEELRPSMADRFVLTLVNNRMVSEKSFRKLESGAVIMTDETRKLFLRKWQERKQDELMHPYLKEKVQWGMIPFVQSMLLARYIRGDIDAYPPFLWK